MDEEKSIISTLLDYGFFNRLKQETESFIEFELPKHMLVEIPSINYDTRIVLKRGMPDE